MKCGLAGVFGSFEDSHVKYMVGALKMTQHDAFLSRGTFHMYISTQDMEKCRWRNTIN